MQYNQQDNKVFITNIEKNIQQNQKQYTWKEINGIKLIPKYGRISIPKAAQS